MFEFIESPKKVELRSSPNANRRKLKRVNLRKFNLENDVIYDAEKVICNINLKKFGDMAHSAIVPLEVF